MKVSDFNIANFNQSTGNGVASSHFNFCQAVSMSYAYNLSITAKYAYEDFLKKNAVFAARTVCEGIEKEYAVLRRDLSVEIKDTFEDYYYGVSPRIDSDLIISAIASFCFSSPAGLNEFLSLHCKDFMLHGSMEAYLPAFARHAVLTMAAKYGICIGRHGDLEACLKREDPHGEIARIGEDQILLCGCPTEAMCRELEKYHYRLEEEKWLPEEKGISFREIYENKKNIKLLVGKVFYSGVLIKPLRIFRPEERFENYKMKNVTVLFERTTFAAVCALDEVHVGHPLLKDEDRRVISELMYRDDECKREMKSALERLSPMTEEAVQEAVNRYLIFCFNVNQIGVSANVITAENRMLLGRRKAGNIDEGLLYPGVNGNAEIKDDGVSFYTYSVYEDDPTIRLENKRIDFIDEIAREAYGEIRLVCSHKWLCYGMILLGRISEKGDETKLYPEKKRRMHFNIIFEQESDQSHAQIDLEKRRASESFETDEFLGLRVQCYRNGAHFLLRSMSSFFHGIVANRDAMESVALIVFMIMALMGKEASPEILWIDLVSYGFAALIMALTLVRFYRFCRQTFALENSRLRRRYPTKKLRIFLGWSYEKMHGRIHRAIGDKYHPAAYAATKLYAENLVHDILYREEKERSKKRNRKK